MKKRIVAFFLAIVMIFTLFSVPVFAEPSVTGTFDNGVVTVVATGLRVGQDYQVTIHRYQGTPTAFSLNTAVDGSFTVDIAIGNVPGTHTIHVMPVGLGGAGATGTVSVANVTAVNVIPAAADVRQGETQQFSAEVVGAGNPPQGVTWTASTGIITDTGLLTVPSTAVAGSTITVTATSVFNPAVFGTATVTVTAAPIPEPIVTGVAVTPATGNVQQGTTRQFTATVAGTNLTDAARAVTWTTSHGTINATGLLTVPAATLAGTVITVTATSVFNPAVSGTATATVTTTPAPPPPPGQVFPPAWGPTFTPPGTNVTRSETIPVNYDAMRVVVRERSNRLTLSFPTPQINRAVETAVDGTVILGIQAFPNAISVTFPRAAIERFSREGLQMRFDMSGGQLLLNAADVANLLREQRIGSITVYLRDDVPVFEDDLPPDDERVNVLRFEIGSRSYTINDMPVGMLDAAPFIEGDRTMVPLRVVGERLGTNVGWVEATRTVTIVGHGHNLQIPVDAPLPGGMGMPIIVADRTFVPLRYVSETLGAYVRWDANARAVYVYL